MLQSIREHTQGWIAGAIISIIILTFALWGIHSYFVSGPNRVVATVNGAEIGREQLTVAYERLRRQVQSQQGASQSEESDLKEQALKALIDMEVLKQASTSQGFLVSSQQVDNYLQSMPEFQVDGQFSVDRFQQVLASTLMTTGDFLDVIKSGLLIDQPRLGIVLTSFALPGEASSNVALVNEERDIDYIDVPRNLFVADVKGVSAADINKYYVEHRDEFMTPEKASVEYIELSVKDLISRFHPTEAALKSYYNENLNTYTRPAAWKLTGIVVPVTESASSADVKAAEAKANELYAQLEKGDKFDKVAINHPTKSIGNGDFVTLNHVPAQLQSVVVELKDNGALAKPVKTDDGFIILRATDVREPQVESFTAVEQRVKDAYLQQKAEEKFAELRERLADLTYEHPDSLTVAANELGLTVKSTALFTKDDASEGIEQYKKVRDITFSNDVLNLQNNSDVIQVTPETVVVLRIKSHLPSSLLPLENVSAQISENLSKQEADEKARVYANELLHKVQAGDLNPSMLSSRNLSWVTKGYIGRYSTRVDTAVLDLAFRLPKPSFINKKSVYGVTKMPNGYALVAVKGVKQGSRDSSSQMDVFSEQYQNSEGLLEYELYKQSLIDHAKIKTYL